MIRPALEAPAIDLSLRWQVIHGDCLDVMRELPDGCVDAVVTDPPYGVNGVQNTKTAATRGFRKNDYMGMVDSPEYVARVAVPAIAMCVERGWRVVVTPGNRCLTLYPMPDSFGAIWQPTSVGLQPWGRADSQPILYYGKSPYGGKELPARKCSFRNTETAEANGHPCPKPIGLMGLLVTSATREGELVLDPFCGSGTTGVAAISHGRRFIGIEIEAKYVEIARRRIADAAAQTNLFDGAAPVSPESTA